ncbi:hypothetical protein IZ6_23400 [Terrihabitans soli]|uniref:Uncharacterized protein n=1 Tax=Terrihabitans soli TaxID=708113 RepID=A0A6S6QVK3_9HYPH|nr:hypothetical protein [Terrihabitans soli]BCJ91605.1 hypothetical protein IZ6_23400 [Terrihabitans soli]
MSDIVFQRIDVLTDGGSQEGRLALAEGQLVAVFVHVTPEETANGGGWFREAGFGPCSDLVAQVPPVFDSLEGAAAWIDERIQAGPLPG